MRRVVEGMLVVAVLLDATYWTLWYADRDLVASEKKQAYYDFENAFPLADLWLAVTCVLALVALRRRRPAALFWLLCAGSSGVYLACMDLLYDLEHGIFARGAAGAFEAVVVTLTVVFAVTVLA